MCVCLGVCVCVACAHRQTFHARVYKAARSLPRFLSHSLSLAFCIGLSPSLPDSTYTSTSRPLFFFRRFDILGLLRFGKL